MICILRILLAFSLLLSSTSLGAVPGRYQYYAALYDLDKEIFFSVALQESGRNINGKRLPWPWTLNVDGKGFYFQTREECEAHLIEALKTTSNVGIGLYQITWRWNRQYFSDPTALLNVDENINHAAWLLRNHLEKNGSYELAVMDYHAPNKTWKTVRANYLRYVIKRYKENL